MTEKYLVRLTTEEREELTALVTKGKTSAAKIRHAQILLKADAEGPNWTDAQIADAFSVHRNTVAGIRKRLVCQGVEAALNRQPQAYPSRPRSWMGRGKPGCWRSVAANRRRVRPAGRCGCWPTGWWNWVSSSGSRMKVSDGC